MIQFILEGGGLNSAPEPHLEQLILFEEVVWKQIFSSNAFAHFVCNSSNDACKSMFEQSVWAIPKWTNVPFHVMSQLLWTVQCSEFISSTMSHPVRKFKWVSQTV